VKDGFTDEDGGSERRGLFENWGGLVCEGGG